MKVIRVTDSSVFVSNEEGSFLEYPMSSCNFNPQVGDEVQLSAEGMKLEKLASKIDFFDDNSQKKQGILKKFQKVDVLIRANLICLLFSIVLSAVLFFTSTKEEFLTNIALSIFLTSIFLIATNFILLCWSLFKKHGKLIKKSSFFLLYSFILLLVAAFLHSSNSNQISSGSSENTLNTVENEENGQDDTVNSDSTENKESFELRSNDILGVPKDSRLLDFLSVEGNHVILIGVIEEYADYYYPNKLSNGNSVFRLALVGAMFLDPNSDDFETINFNYNGIYLEIDSEQASELEKLKVDGKYPGLYINALSRPSMDFKDEKNNTIRSYAKVVTLEDSEVVSRELKEALDE